MGSPTEVRIITDSGYQILREVDGISFQGVSTICEDREGNIWAGKDGGGLLRLRRTQVEMLTEQDGLPSNLTQCGVQDRSGVQWFGAWEGGLARRVKRAPQRFERISFPRPVVSIMTLCEGRDNSLWVGTWALGVFRIRDGRAEQFAGGAELEYASIDVLAEDGEGALWVGTVHDGIFYYAVSHSRERGRDGDGRMRRRK